MCIIIGKTHKGVEIFTHQSCFYSWMESICKHKLVPNAEITWKLVFVLKGKKRGFSELKSEKHNVSLHKEY